MFHPKKIVTVLGISALFLAPVLPIPFDLGSGPAFADNGKGGGGGGNGGGNGGGGGKGGDRGGERGGEKSAGKAGANGGNGNGGGKPAERTVTREKPAAAKPATRQAAPAAQGDDTVLAARDLGNMNGAMNANINAVLAHVRNANYNGPVGAVAGLMAADAKAGDLVGSDILDRADAWEAYRAALVEGLGSDYQAALDGYVADRAAFDQYQIDLAAWTEADAAYQAALADPTLTAEEIAALDPGLAPEEVVFQTDPVIEALLAQEPEVEEPSADDLALVAAVSDAEAAVLALWNKNPADADGMSDEEAALLSALRARFSPADLEAIAAAAGS